MPRHTSSKWRPATSTNDPARTPRLPAGMSSPPCSPLTPGRPDRGLPTGRLTPPCSPQAPGAGEPGDGGKGRGEGVAGHAKVPGTPGLPGPPTPPSVGGPDAGGGPAPRKEMTQGAPAAAVMVWPRHDGGDWQRTVNGHPAGRAAGASGTSSPGKGPGGRLWIAPATYPQGGRRPRVQMAPSPGSAVRPPSWRQALRRATTPSLARVRTSRRRRRRAARCSAYKG